MKTTYTYFNDGSKKIIGTEGREIWYDSNDNIHRLNGPAITYAWFDIDADPNSETYLKKQKHTRNQWYYRGKRIECDSQEQFARLVNLKMFW